MTPREIEERCRRAGLSLARLARQAGVRYGPLWTGARLRPDELARIESVLSEQEARAT